MPDDCSLDLSQVTTFDIGEFSAMVSDPSWIVEYARNDWYK